MKLNSEIVIQPRRIFDPAGVPMDLRVLMQWHNREEKISMSNLLMHSSKEFQPQAGYGTVEAYADAVVPFDETARPLWEIATEIRSSVPLED